MKRRDFILKTALSTIAALIASKFSFAVSSDERSFNRIFIPIGMEHTRHGLFNPKALDHPLIPPRFRVYERQVFYSNGYSPSHSDIVSYSFKIKDDLITILKKNTELHCRYNTENQIQLTGNKRIMENSDINVRLLKLSSSAQLAANDFVVAIAGTAQMNDQILNEGFAFLTQRECEIYPLERETSVLVFSSATKACL